MNCNQKEGLDAIQRPKHRMVGPPRQQVHAFLRCEQKGFVASGIEILQSLGKAPVLAGWTNRFRSRPPVNSIQDTFLERCFLCRVPLGWSSSLRCLYHAKEATLDEVYMFQAFQNRPPVGRRPGPSLLFR